MADREKVIKGLETIKQFFEYGLPSTAEMFDSYYDILNSAIALLKEQEALSIVYRENLFTGLPVAHCPRCGKCANHFNMGQYGEETHFCPYCGQEVKWDES